MTPAIRIQNLSKVYKLGDRLNGDYETFRDVLVGVATAPWRAIRNRLNPDARKAHTGSLHWALRDVSFDVRPGDVVGLIGRNGAGKSTLLKVLSRITEPTSGRVELRGRVGSLLEVGTGFHSELTGRENIYQNGAILGMTRREIDRKFDQIVAFAEVDEFLDTPVKRYSSGMYVRLAFAVAANLEPEILIVDEVLAVGDAQFQKKCLGKMEDVARGGRTVFFVSHNMSAVQRLCNRVVYLREGNLVAYGDKDSVLPLYLAECPQPLAPGAWLDLTKAHRSGNGEVRVLALQYHSRSPQTAGHPYTDGPLDLSLAIDSATARTVTSIRVTLQNLSGTKLLSADTHTLGKPWELRAGRNELQFRIGSLHLNPGKYLLGVGVANYRGQLFDQIDAAVELEVVELQAAGLGGRRDDDGPVSCPFDVAPLQ